VTVSRTSNNVLIRVQGEAGVRQAGRLMAGLLVPAALRPGAVTLDLSGLASISSLAMGVLTTYRRGVVRGGGRVRLLPELREQVRAELERAGILELFGDGASPSPSPAACEAAEEATYAL
jgi:anti-anti-sigma factor